MLKAQLARKALHASLTGLYVYDFKDGINIFINDEYTRLTGYTLEQLNSMPGNEFLALFHPENRERVIHHWTALREANDGDVLEIDYRFRRADGEWIWCLSRDSVLEREPAGSVRRVVGSFLDITERKRTEEALRESEARFRTMADGLPLIVWVHDARGEQEFVNRTFCEFFGVTEQEMHGDRWQSLIHPDDADGYAEKFFACTREQRPFHDEVRARRADGVWRWLESWARPRLSADGEFLGVVGASADVTARKQAEESLRHSESRYRELVQSANSAIIRWNCACLAAIPRLPSARWR